MKDRTFLELWLTRQSNFPCMFIVAIMVLVTSALPSSAAAAGGRPNVDHFQNINRIPDAVTAFTENGTVKLQAKKRGVWKSDGITVTTRRHRDGLTVKLSAPVKAMIEVDLRWRAIAAPSWKYLGDAWERAYGNLEWKFLDPRRVMPWYFLVTDGRITDGYGVKTGPAAMCYWTVDVDSITLHADVRCGGRGVHLGKRVLKVCTVVCRKGNAHETPFAAAQAFCGQMCSRPRLPQKPVYGFNDWYCTYGKDTAENFLKNTAYLVNLTPKGGVKPFAVVDGGWEEDSRHAATSNMWNHPNPNFSKTMSMQELAGKIRELGARPGLWCRPLIAGPDMPQSWRLAQDPQFLDPTVPAVRSYLTKIIRRFHTWGFQLIKVDYMTYDLLGRWGNDMGDNVTTNGWTFADDTKTTAEIIRDLYLDIRKAAGNKTLIIGCNTIGQLSAGIFQIQRIGDDTSGLDWDRTLKMGVNCLAFRAPQNGAFFAVDADCAGQTTAHSIAWAKNSQWLYLQTHSGTVSFTSFPRDILNPKQQNVLKADLAAAARRQRLAQPLDWLDSRTPERWWIDGKKTVTFHWKTPLAAAAGKLH